MRLGMEVGSAGRLAHCPWAAVSLLCADPVRRQWFVRTERWLLQGSLETTRLWPAGVGTERGWGQVSDRVDVIHQQGPQQVADEAGHEAPGAQPEPAP